MEIDQIAEAVFDYLVIAIESIQTASQVYENLIDKGIEKNKILNLNMRNRIFPLPLSLERRNDKLKICVFDGGGFGDVLIDMIFIRRLRELVTVQGEIILCCKYVDYFKRFEQIDKIREYELAKADKEMRDCCDLIFIMHSVVIIEKCQGKKVKEVSEQLYTYCEDCIRSYKELFSEYPNNYRFTKYALLLGKNRIEHVDIHGLLEIKRTDTLKIPIYKGDLRCLDENGIIAKRYITINRDTGGCSDTHTKLWPVEYYMDLLGNIRATYPDICIVLIGSRKDDRLRPYVDKDLTGKTSLIDRKVF